MSATLTQTDLFGGSMFGAGWLEERLSELKSVVETKLAIWLAQRMDRNLVSWKGLSGFAKETGHDLRNVRRAARRMEAAGLYEHIDPTDIQDPDTLKRYTRYGTPRTRLIRGCRRADIEAARSTTETPGEQGTCAPGTRAPVPPDSTNHYTTGLDDLCDSTIHETNQSTSGRARARERASPPIPDLWDDRPAGEPPPGPPFDPDFDPRQSRPRGQATSPRTAQTPDPAPEPRPAPRQAPPPPARHGPQQASDDLIRPTSEAMRQVWNKAVKGTRIPPILVVNDRRARLFRQVMREACRDQIETWEDLCQWIAGDPFHRGERNGQGHENWVADIDYILRPGVLLRMVEKLVAARRTYDAECKAAGIHNPTAAPEPEQEPVQPVHRSAPDPEAERMMANLPVLTREEILAIYPLAADEMPFPGNDPAIEAAICRNTVLMMRVTGLLPNDGGRDRSPNGRA